MSRGFILCCRQIWWDNGQHIITWLCLQVIWGRVDGGGVRQKLGLSSQEVFLLFTQPSWYLGVVLKFSWNALFGSWEISFYWYVWLKARPTEGKAECVPGGIKRVMFSSSFARWGPEWHPDLITWRSPEGAVISSRKEPWTRGWGNGETRDQNVGRSGHGAMTDPTRGCCCCPGLCSLGCCRVMPSCPDGSKLPWASQAKLPPLVSPQTLFSGPTKSRHQMQETFYGQHSQDFNLAFHFRLMFSFLTGLPLLPLLCFRNISIWKLEWSC